jgi:hypothetical protein
MPGSTHGGVPGCSTGELKEASDELARVKEALEGSEAASAKAVEKAEVRWCKLKPVLKSLSSSA